jgi:Flp pilus assembly protein TadG
MKNLILHKIFRKRSFTAQGMVEFALVLPLLLMLIFGIIEFGRIFQAWLSVQNSARFAVRYAVTGQYDVGYCDDAAIAEVNNNVFKRYPVDNLTNNISPVIDPVTADTYGGDPQDCRVPNTFSTVLEASAPFASMGVNEQSLAVSETIENMTGVLQDYARLHSIHDITREDAFAIALDPTKTLTSDKGYFRVIVFSSRVIASSTVTQSDPGAGLYWDITPKEDAGGPGDSILIGVDFNHPLITPFLMQAWPYLHLTTVRRGIIEQFRASKAINVAPPLLMPSPTASLTPSITASPTATSTPTFTPSPTATNTFTPSPTYTPSETPTLTLTASLTATQTASITLTPSKTSTLTIVPSSTMTPSKTLTPSITPTPGCGNLSMTLGMDGTSKTVLRATIKNNNAAPVTFGSIDVNWNDSQHPAEYLDLMSLNGANFYTIHDFDPPTSAVKSPTVNFNGGGATNLIRIAFLGVDSRGIGGSFTVTVHLDSNRCDLTQTFTRIAPTATVTLTPTNTIPATFTPTRTFTPSLTFTPSKTLTPTNTLVPTNTFTPTETLVPTSTFTRTFTPTKSNTPVPSNTYTPSKTLVPTNTPTLTPTRTNTTTPTATFTFTVAPTNTPTRTFTPTPTKTPIGGGEG